jgi:nucleoside-diphosphate-sugar epimerase
MVPRNPVVVATGVSSFVGMHLARQFAGAGHRVVGTISKPRETYRDIRGERLRALEASAELVQLDVTDAAAVDALIERVAPTLWIHHAGHAVAYASYDYDLAQGFAANVAPLTHLYKSLAGKGCNVIVTGSSAEYSVSDAANREDDACWPDMPYGVSKLEETIRARQLALQFSVPTRVARLYIPFGTYDNPEKLLAQVVAGLRAGKTIELSACTQARDFLGISDLCAAYAALDADMSRTLFDVFNICGGQAVVLREFLLDIATLMNADPALLHFGARPMRPGEAAFSFGSNEKARKILTWRPEDLRAAISADLLCETHR